MRAHRRTLAVCTVLAALIPTASAAQQGSARITAAAQSIQGDPRRSGSQPSFQPDFGVSWFQPGTRLGTFQLDLRATERNDRAHLGRTFLGIRDLKYRGMSWTLEAGDTYFSPAIGEYRFTNLSTPALTFAGGAVSGRSPRTSVAVLVGRATAWRNLYGSDADTLDQDIALGRGTYKATDRVELSARASRVRTGDLKDYYSTIEESDQGGGAARWIITPSLQLVGDGGVVSYLRRGAATRELDGSGLAGASLLLPRGWVQINASRFSPGELPILNQPMTDRQSLFAAGEFDASARLRVFGGWEAFSSNLDPTPSPAGHSTAANDGTRGYAGIRTPVGAASSLALRVETGDRRSRVVDAGLTTVSDTGVMTAEWQTGIGPINGLTRYSRRSNVESANLAGSYTVDDASGHLFVTIKRASQLFGNIVATRTLARDGSGSTFLQLGGGGQTQLLQRSLWVRAEGMVSRNVDVLSAFVVPQQSFNFGVNGEIARNTVIGFNVNADRLASPATTEASWISRSSLRVTRSFQTGSARLPTSILTSMARHGGTGSIAGTVFTDWNANGQQDPGEVVLENIPIRLQNLGSTSTSRAGDFAFINVPIGVLQVGVDVSTLPVDFDPPSIPQVQLHLGRGETKRVAFGLVPLNFISGKVVLDANKNGIEDAADSPVDGAVVVLDAGARSEQARKGRFKFEAVRSGDHTLTLLGDSLPSGAAVSGPAEISLSLTRAQPTADVAFLVTMQERPELRKLFAPTPGKSPNATAPPARRPAIAERRPTVPARSEAHAVATGVMERATPRVSAGTDERPDGFAVQVIALDDPSRARATLSELNAAGLPAYLVEPPASEPDAPYRVRLGRYKTRVDAEAVALEVGRVRGQKLWVVKELRAGS
jgi:cell division septation protein DedD